MAVNVEYINPFLSSVINVLKTMASVDPRPGKPYQKEGMKGSGDVTGIVGIAGPNVKGSMAITFTEKCILQIATNMLGEEMTELDEAIADVVGEITNMVMGGAKRILSEKGHTFEMAIPSTVMGTNHFINHNTKGQVIVVPFDSGAGTFSVEVCFIEG